MLGSLPQNKSPTRLNPAISDMFIWVCFSFPGLPSLSNTNLVAENTHSLTVLEAGSLKPRCQQGRALSKSSREFFRPLPASGGSRNSLVFRSITPVSASILIPRDLLCVSVSPFWLFQGHPHLRLSALAETLWLYFAHTLIYYGLILILN